MNRKQWVYFILMLIFAVLFVFNYLEYQKSEKAVSSLLLMLSNLLFILAMGIMWYYAKRKSK
jgi:cell division protein FtsW (lipid II flippase)